MQLCGKLKYIKPYYDKNKILLLIFYMTRPINKTEEKIRNKTGGEKNACRCL